jgi:hypothetical protein
VQCIIIDSLFREKVRRFMSFLFFVLTFAFPFNLPLLLFTSMQRHPLYKQLQLFCVAFWDFVVWNGSITKSFIRRFNFIGSQNQEQKNICFFFLSLSIPLGCWYHMVMIKKIVVQNVYFVLGTILCLYLFSYQKFYPKLVVICIDRLYHVYKELYDITHQRK